MFNDILTLVMAFLAAGLAGLCIYDYIYWNTRIPVWVFFVLSILCLVAAALVLKTILEKGVGV